MTDAPMTQVRDGIGGMYPQGAVFHWRDGWYFCRGEFLGVHIWNIKLDVNLTIPRSEWDSIADHLSHPSARNTITSLQAQRDELAEVLVDLVKYDSDPSKFPDDYGTKALRRARAALANAVKGTR